MGRKEERGQKDKAEERRGKEVLMKHHPNQVSVTVINTMTKTNLRREAFNWLPYPNHCSSLREVRAGT